MPLQPRATPPRRAARGFLLALVLLLSLASVTGAEEQSWEGNAAVVRKGEFGSEGLFAASDSFPKNTLLQVENPQNAKTVQVTVVERINGSGNVFLLLSEQAAAALGLSASEVIRVKARVLLAAGGAGRNGSQDLTRSLDSDVNPAAALAGLPEPSAMTTETPAETSPVAESAEPAATAPDAAAVTAAAPVAPETIAAPTSAPEAPALSATDRRLQELTSRQPQKQLFLPRRDSGAFALQEEAPPETASIAEASAEPTAVEPAVAETPALPPEQPVAQEAPVAEQAPLPAQAAEELPLAEAAVAETATEEEATSEEPPALSLGATATSAADTPEWTAPAPSAPAAEEPAAPAQEPPSMPVVEAPPAPEAPPVVAAVPPAPAPSALVRRSFYLQLGAYSTRSLAEKLAREVSTYARFTVAVLPAASGSRQLYKVLVGPLNRDESGTLLYQFRARGFKDAFVQFVE